MIPSLLSRLAEDIFRANGGADVHCTNLRAPVHLVRIFPHRLLWDLQVQSRSRRSRLCWHPCRRSVDDVGFNSNLPNFFFTFSIADNLLCSPLLFTYLRIFVEPKFDENGNLPPEDRLPPSFLGAFAIPICLFWFGWSARPDVHWYVTSAIKPMFHPDLHPFFLRLDLLRPSHLATQRSTNSILT